jgi:hypothetical protein
LGVNGFRFGFRSSQAALSAISSRRSKAARELCHLGFPSGRRQRINPGEQIGDLVNDKAIHAPPSRTFTEATPTFHLGDGDAQELGRIALPD